jgi:Holliday junction resolvasome RuvABC DNA-binding subunit
MDTSFFQAIPGIGPKSAKKIILEMKGNLDVDEIQQMNSNQKYFTSILKTLKGLGYEPETVKSKLSEYKNPITKENMSQVIKRVISKI